MEKPIYLDYNGTTPLDIEVLSAMHPFLEEEFGNPSSSHWYGIVPKQAVAKARGQVASILNCDPSEIVFTSGGTESNNHAISGTAFAFREKGDHIITSQIEHPAVLEVCRRLERYGCDVDVPPGERIRRSGSTRRGKGHHASNSPDHDHARKQRSRDHPTH